MGTASTPIYNKSSRNVELKGSPAPTVHDHNLSLKRAEGGARGNISPL